MTHIFRKLASVRSSKHNNQSKGQITEYLKSDVLNKERDRLLQEFLLARDELKGQFDYEKRELVTNYERRLKYLRRLIEQYDENINMLKLNLDAEKEENFMLKTKIMEVENEVKKKNQSPGFHNRSYEDESTLEYSDNEDGNQMKSELDITSSLDGLKYSNKSRISKSSIDSIAKSSFTSTSSLDVQSYKSYDKYDEDIHHNCRQEFNRLLQELRKQKTNFDDELESERENMHEQIENQRLQLEKIVYKQLNLKLEKEVKRHELLYTENAHLRKTITQTAIESMMDQLNSKQVENVDSWKETNSDSGADVEYNRSDDESDASTVSKHSRICSSNSMSSTGINNQEETVSATLICSLLEAQKTRLTCAYQKQKLREQKKLKTLIGDLQQEVMILSKENRKLKEEVMVGCKCFDDVSEFHFELSRKLLNLEELLTDDPDAC